MLQIGIRLHDVNTTRDKAFQSMEERAKTARAEGFSCVHLALHKVIEGVTFDDAAMTEGLAMHIKRVFAQNDLDVAVLGCYLNLAHPDPVKLAEIQSRYVANIRVASEKLKNSEGLLGKILDDKELADNASKLMENLKSVSDKLAKGEGTLGKLTTDQEMYDEVNGLIKDVRQIVDNYRDTTPISTFAGLIGGAL